MKPKQLFKFIAALAACFGVGGFGTIFTTQDSIINWYAQLQKPDFTPLSWVFGPAWTILYLLMAISVFLIWNKGLDYPHFLQSQSGKGKEGEVSPDLLQKIVQAVPIVAEKTSR